MIELEEKSKKEDYDEAVDFLELDKESVDNKAKVSLPKITSESGKLLMIQNIALEYRYTLEGKKKTEDGTGYVQATKALAPRDFIDITFSMLNSFAEQSNLVTGKDMDGFIIQYKDAFLKFNNMILRNRGIQEEHYSSLIKLFKDKLLNIGEIITNNRGNMEAIISGCNKDEEEATSGLADVYN